eukprot:GHVU01080921.1.p1 GENE.GHVU01080921.1~~GHVU01080921.1.p1  ORF type:complete len:101 (-),score=2.54 GHVU01080921.1:437-739(-)
MAIVATRNVERYDYRRVGMERNMLLFDSTPLLILLFMLSYVSVERSYGFVTQKVSISTLLRFMRELGFKGRNVKFEQGASELEEKAFNAIFRFYNTFGEH